MTEYLIMSGDGEHPSVLKKVSGHGEGSVCMCVRDMPHTNRGLPGDV